jgi:2-succinyl-5-enolpyruvyl-6-hydroxy-3-cyclohexene-1-carboxylate synthase
MVMNKNAENINILWANLIIEEFVRNAIEYCCISPGSRSTPLVIAAARNPFLQKIVCYDERGAAFAALGHARASGKPAIIISTSGTAAADFFPAIIEASIDCIPLIVLTADRPPELRDSGANQTIYQTHLYGTYVRWHCDLSCPDKAILPEMVLTTIDQAVYRAISLPQGPVHINCMFREPLAPIADNSIPETYENDIQKWYSQESPYTLYLKTNCILAQETVDHIADIIHHSKHPLCVVGRLHTNREREALKQLFKNTDIPVFPDILSGLRTDSSLDNIIHYFDQMLLSEKFIKKNNPDTILHFGGQLVSARFLQMIQRFPPRQYILITDNPFRLDPMHRVTVRVMCSLSNLCDSLKLHFIGDKNEWLADLKNGSRKIEDAINEFLHKKQNITEIGVARMLSELIPPDHGLFLASSMPIRDMDMYASANGKASCIAANRGVSGIDGTIASAVGYSAGMKMPVTVLIGDIAFIHDLNSLSLISSAYQKLIICVINNYGGGIFSFLPIADLPDVFEKYFAASHTFNFKAAANLFNLSYANPSTILEFKTQYAEALQSPSSTIIELISDRKDNIIHHNELQHILKDIIEI